ncbi:large ribosomal subunit protein bL20m [Paroedura picta]|uniref:large ribosomal subunit protein bL20m n=1 Tax=Paroedura picta TaxID=143630 RepID=UPI001013DD2B
MVFLSPALWIRTRKTDRFWRKWEVLKNARHFRGRKNRCYTLAVRVVRKAWFYSTKARALRKSDMRTLWITRLTAAALEHRIKYHNFISGLYKCQVELNRKVLADMAIYEPKTFKSLAALAKRRGEEGLVAATEGKEPEGIFSRYVPYSER